MAFASDSFGRAVMERILEMSNPDVPWAQRLWRSSAVDAVRHCLALAESGARDGAKAHAIGTARQSIETDPFVPAAERAGILKALTIKAERLIAGSAATHSLRALETELSHRHVEWVSGFLTTIEDSRRVSEVAVSGDMLAWQLAAHLRTLGFSDTWISRFVSYHLKHDREPLTLAAVIEKAHVAATRGRDWVFLVPLERRRAFNEVTPPLLTPRDFEARFAQLHAGKPMPAHRGGLEIRVNAMDKYEAIERVRLEVLRIVGRHRAAGGTRRLVPQGHAWVSPGNWDADLGFLTAPRVRFRHLDAGGGSGMFGRQSEELEAAIDLLIAGDQSSVRAATMAAWAVLETLFADESDFGELAALADRAADILVCLFVKDAFGSIARGHARAGDDELALRLRDADAATQAMLVEASLQKGHLLSVSSTLGEIARQRAAGLNVAGVNVVRHQIAAVLRRLYDTRNQIVHAGLVDPVGMDRTYFESTILLSALIDELHDQDRDFGRPAREVAGRASWMFTRVNQGRATPASLAALSRSV